MLPPAVLPALALAMILGPLGTAGGAIPDVRSAWKRQSDDGDGHGDSDSPSTPFFTLVIIAPDDSDVDTQELKARGGYFFVDPSTGDDDDEKVKDDDPPTTSDPGGWGDGDCENGGGYGDGDDCDDGDGEDKTALTTDGEGGACIVESPFSTSPTHLRVFLSTDTGHLQYLVTPSSSAPGNAQFKPFQRLGAPDPGTNSPATGSRDLLSVFDWGSVRPDLTTAGWFGCPAPSTGNSAALRITKMVVPAMEDQFDALGCRGPWELGVVDVFEGGDGDDGGEDDGGDEEEQDQDDGNQ
ncbi:hypothetical protein MKZ38_008460 [Zalerion maritima]|uniref:Uncharacterized protein n=1 Tax=Zalerion maritima TaxID=339359 RepID=A0AAD5RU81_9PEZI|nr:hypothetical protein MKZ38_008460 [Zalerion maritima]